MKTGFWAIVKGAVVFTAFTSALTVAIVYILSTKETSATLNDIVVPQLDYLVKADSANKARDEVMACKIDSTRIVVDALAKTRTEEIVNDPSLTREEFLQEMKPFMEYIDDIKKNEIPIVYERRFPLWQKWDTLLSIPQDWIPQPSTNLILTNRK